MSSELVMVCSKLMKKRAIKLLLTLTATLVVLFTSISPAHAELKAGSEASVLGDGDSQWEQSLSPNDELGSDKGFMSDLTSDGTGSQESSKSDLADGRGQEAVDGDDRLTASEGEVSDTSADDNLRLYAQSDDSSFNWQFDEESGVLTVSGSGQIPDYSSASETPWAAYAQQVVVLDINLGITSIGAYAFSGMKQLASVSIPEGVITVGRNAFDGCPSIETLVLPNSISTIGYRAFANCTALTSVNIPTSWNSCPSYNDQDDVNYRGHIFQGSKSLSNVTVESGVESIPTCAFAYCDYLQTIQLPASVSEIGSRAFYGCSRLSGQVIPEGVEIISKSMFNNCSALTNVSIPASVTRVGSYAFYRCSSLAALSLPDTVESIGYQAFANCTSLASVNIPASWSECPSYNDTVSASYCGHVFQGCSKLASVAVPDGVEELPPYAFAYCDRLKSVELPGSLTDLGNHAFYACSYLESVAVPEGVAELKKSVFCNCSKLSDVSLPQSLTGIGPYAFSGCSSLAALSLPDTVESIGYQAFANCTSLASVNIPASWSECPSYNDTVSASYCGHVFQGCSKLASVAVPDGVEELPPYAFAYCDRLKSVELPGSLTDLGNHAFYKCSSLEELILPDSITSIGYRALADCTALADINIPLSWNECQSNAADGTMSSDYCGHIFEGNKNLQQITIPDGMEKLPEYAFCHSNYITTVILPDSFRSFSQRAFYKCTSLTYIRYPDSVEKVEAYAFAGCTALRAAVFPKLLSTIESHAYEGCSSLVALSMPKSLISIGENAFKSCNELSHVYYEGNEEEWQALISGSASRALTTQASIGSSIAKAKVSYGILCDYAEPDFIRECSYVKPDNVSYDSFYGASIWADGFQLVDVDDATFGKNAKTTAISLPKNSYITYGFQTSMMCGNDAVILITTEGINGADERADIYVETLSGRLEFVETVYEYTRQHTICLNDVDDFVTGIKVVGRDLGGKWPGFDIVDIALMAKDSGEVYNKDSKTTVNLQKDGKVYDLLKEERVYLEGNEKAVSILVSPDWGDSPQGSVLLVQNNQIILQNSGGSFVDLNPGEIFASGKTIYAVLMTEIDGKSKVLESLPLKLSIGSSAHIGKTTTDYRRYKTKELYLKQKNLNRETVADIKSLISSHTTDSSSPAIPGLENTYTGVNVNSFVPQGLCKFSYKGEKYYLITAYDKAGKHNSVLYVLDQSFKFIKNITLPNKYHNGGIAYDPVGDMLWFCGDTNKSSDYEVWCYGGAKLGKLITASGKAVAIDSFDYRRDVDNKPSCLDYHDGRLWVGTCNTGKGDPETIVGYSAEGSELDAENKVTIVGVEKYLNGFTFGGNGDIYVSYSSGRYSSCHSRIKHFQLDGLTYRAGSVVKLSGGVSRDAPRMNEEIVLDGNMLYVLYESAATAYIGNAYIVTDRITGIDASAWGKASASSKNSAIRTSAEADGDLVLNEGEPLQVEYAYDGVSAADATERTALFTPEASGRYELGVAGLNHMGAFAVTGVVTGGGERMCGVLSTLTTELSDSGIERIYNASGNVEVNLVGGRQYAIALTVTAPDVLDGESFTGSYELSAHRVGDVVAVEAEAGKAISQEAQAGSAPCFEFTPQETGAYRIAWDATGELLDSIVSDDAGNTIDVKDGLYALEAGRKYRFEAVLGEADGFSESATVSFGVSPVREAEISPDANTRISDDVVLVYRSKFNGRQLIEFSSSAESITVSVYDSAGSLIALGVNKTIFTAEQGAGYRIVCTGVEGSADITVSPYKVDIANLGATMKADLVYGAKLALPTPTVVEGQYKLVEGADYTVAYSSDAKSVGAHAVTVTGIGDYKGVRKIDYTVKPMGTTIAKLKAGKKAFKVTWKKKTAKMATKRITGYEVRYSTSEKMTKAKTKMVKGYRKASLTVKKLKSKKKYYVQVRTYMIVSGKKYCSAWSKAKTVKTKKK